MEEEKILIGIDLSTASKEVIDLLIEEATDNSIFEEIAKANMNRPEIIALLLESPDTPEHVRQQISQTLSLPVKALSQAAARVKKSPEARAQNIFQKIQKLSVSERIHLALRGGKEIRSILLRDPSKEVVMTVLENPKMTETEIEIITRSRSVPDEVLRKITKKREWMKNYNIILGLATNPKTPPGIALPLVAELKTRDLAIIEKNRNVSEGVRATAKKLVRARKAH
jgi:nucleotide-binding universal stress UspA family protein